MSTKWVQVRLKPRPVVKVRLADEVHTVEGLVIAWSTSQLRVRLRWGVSEFWRSDGRSIRGGGGAAGAAITPMTLGAINNYIRAFEAEHASDPVARPAKSAHVLVVWNDQGSVAVEGGGKLVRLLVPTGYEPEKVAAELESIIAWAETRARSSARHSRRGAVAGAKSAARRKTVRTKRRGEP